MDDKLVTKNIYSLGDINAPVDTILHRLSYSRYALNKKAISLNEFTSLAAAFVNSFKMHLKDNGTVVLLIEDERADDEDSELRTPLLFVDGLIVTKLVTMGWELMLRIHRPSEERAEVNAYTNCYYLRKSSESSVFYESGVLDDAENGSLSELVAFSVLAATPKGGSVLEVYPFDDTIVAALSKETYSDVILTRLRKKA